MCQYKTNGCQVLVYLNNDVAIEADFNYKNFLGVGFDETTTARLWG